MGLVLLGFGIKEVVVSYLIIRILSALVYSFILFKLLPDIQLRPMWHRSTFPKLIHFGGWILISALVGPLMVNFDRILIGSLLSVTAVTYYVVPYGMVSKLGIIHGSAVPVLFPAFSSRGALSDKTSLQNLFMRSVNLLIIVMLPFVFIIFIFAGEILKIWMGLEFAQRSTIVAQILTFAVLINGLATIPYTTIQGLGRPDLTAKFHLIEIPIYIGLCLFLIPLYGINGVALAWAIRVSIDAILLFWSAKRIAGLSIRSLFSNEFVRGLVLGTGFGVIMFWIRSFTDQVLTQGILIAISLGFYILIIWRYGLDEVDRSAFVRVKSGLFKKEVAS
jgi:O-antigen/teichoic acid export membrane protein